METFFTATNLFIVLGAIVSIFLLLLPFWYRVVVTTNEVHVVQRGRNTVYYGAKTKEGNVYYAWPSWWPYLGVQVIPLPVSNFSIDIPNYDAYDKGRLPLVLDAKAFFVIDQPDTAAQRVSSFASLKTELIAVVQGALRKMMASSTIEEIMEGRSKFGKEFTEEVAEQLKSWGVVPIKTIELMDIRDAQGSNVIKNIMEKKKSFIEMEARTEVALNNKKAQIAEVEAKREVDLQKQEAEQQVGLRTVEAKKTVELAEEAKKQSVLEQSKITTERNMEVERVTQVKRAEIQKQAQVVKAEQDKETAIIKANQDKETRTLAAEATLEAARREAEADLEKKTKEATGITAVGKAEAEAETAKLLAPVNAQTTLAKEIGSNEGYQKYLLGIEQLKVSMEIGIKQAETLAAGLTKAEIKIIANTGNAVDGIKSATDLFSSRGGTQVGSMLEGFANTDLGNALLNKFGLTKEDPTTKEPTVVEPVPAQLTKRVVKGNGRIDHDQPTTR